MTTSNSTDTKSVNPIINMDCLHKEFTEDEKALKVQALSVLSSTLAGRPDTDHAWDMITVMQMALEEMTDKGIKVQSERIAYINKKLAGELS